MMLSPLAREDMFTSRFSTSARKRFAASSNDARVRVLASKKRFATVRPLQNVVARRGGADGREVARRERRGFRVEVLAIEKAEVDQMAQLAALVELLDIDGHRVSLIHCSAIRHAATRSVLSRPTRRRRNPERRAFVSSVCAATEVSVSSTVATGSR